MTEIIGSVANFDAEPGLANRAGTGKLPEGTPDSFPEAEQPLYQESVTFDVPDAARETVSRRTQGADPHVGRAGAT